MGYAEDMPGINLNKALWPFGVHDEPSARKAEDEHCARDVPTVMPPFLVWAAYVFPESCGFPLFRFNITV